MMDTRSRRVWIPFLGLVLLVAVVWLAWNPFADPGSSIEVGRSSEGTVGGSPDSGGKVGAGDRVGGREERESIVDPPGSASRQGVRVVDSATGRPVRDAVVSVVRPVILDSRVQATLARDGDRVPSFRAMRDLVAVFCVVTGANVGSWHNVNRLAKDRSGRYWVWTNGDANSRRIGVTDADGFCPVTDLVAIDRVRVTHAEYTARSVRVAHRVHVVELDPGRDLLVTLARGGDAKDRRAVDLVFAALTGSTGWSVARRIEDEAGSTFRLRVPRDAGSVGVRCTTAGLQVSRVVAQAGGAAVVHVGAIPMLRVLDRSSRSSVGEFFYESVRGSRGKRITGIGQQGAGGMMAENWWRTFAESGGLELRVSSKGYEPRIVRVLRDRHTRTEEVLLDPRATASFELRLIGPGSEAVKAVGLSSAGSSNAFWDAGRLPVLARADREADGSFRFWLGGDRYVARIPVSDHHIHVPFRVEESGVCELDLSRLHSLRIVVSGDRTTIRDSWTCYAVSDSRQLIRASLNEKKEFVLRGLPQPGVDVVVDKGAGQYVRKRVSLPFREQQPLTLMEKRATRRVLIEADGPGGDWEGRFVGEDWQAASDEGAFLVDKERTGDFELRLRGVPVCQVAIRGGAGHDVRVDLKELRTASFLIQDKDGRPASTVEVGIVLRDQKGIKPGYRVPSFRAKSRPDGKLVINYPKSLDACHLLVDRRIEFVPENRISGLNLLSLPRAPKWRSSKITLLSQGSAQGVAGASIWSYALLDSPSGTWRLYSGDKASTVGKDGAVQLRTGRSSRVGLRIRRPDGRIEWKELPPLSDGQTVDMGK